MKQYSRSTKAQNTLDNQTEVSDIPMVELLKKLGVEDPQPIMSSKEFSEYWFKHVRQMATFKKYDKSTRKFRDTSYASIGVMDANDILQEASYAFMKAWSNIDWKKINKANPEDRDKVLWGYLKGTTMLNMNIQIRNNKDGMRITQHGLFASKESQDKNKNVKAITSLFFNVDQVFKNAEDDMGASKYETDLIGGLLEELMDEVLDKKSSGEPKDGGIEKFVLMNVMGIDGHMTYDELSNHFGVSKQSLMSVKKRALKKLREPKVMLRISEFMNEYGIETNSDARNFEII